MQLFGTAEQAKLFCPGTKVPSLSRDKGTAGQAQKLATGRDGRDFLRLSHPVPGRPAGQNHHLFGTIMPFSELKKKSKKHSLVILSRGTSRDRESCPWISPPALVPGQRDSGTRKLFCPGTKGQRDLGNPRLELQFCSLGMEIFLTFFVFDSKLCSYGYEKLLKL